MCKGKLQLVKVLSFANTTSLGALQMMNSKMESILIRTITLESPRNELMCTETPAVAQALIFLKQFLKFNFIGHIPAG